ncbi:hypothetical protein PVAND_017127 [Polypedilum vanderplanki]|uniref:Uncharacterized protein n=1 Tax=Polypedilum vanderplanki TaxID=319348 RepID=A0A9J6BI76_POLVA|nr:hypothetical protein PVAND_017127 [Polypedilum vanderplanki]
MRKVHKTEFQTTVAKSSRLGVENFARGELNDAQSYFKIAFKNAEPDSKEEKIYKELLDVTNLIIDAVSDLKQKKNDEFVIKMDNAYEVCHNEKMKLTNQKIKHWQVGNFGLKTKEKLDKDIKNFKVLALSFEFSKETKALKMIKAKTKIANENFNHENNENPNDLLIKLEKLKTCFELVNMDLNSLQNALVEFKNGKDLERKTKIINERTELFRMSSNTMLKACNDFMTSAQAQK